MSKTSFSIARRTFVAACIMTAASLAQAAWPERPITIVVPYAPGGAADAGEEALAR